MDPFFQGEPASSPSGGERRDFAPDETQQIQPPTAAERRFHHYELCLRPGGTTLHELGRGAMGISYKARDVNLDNFVAIKLIRASVPEQFHARERFRREARAAAQLRHPNVASVFHFGETADGTCFYAMEFIEGETLAARVARDGPLPGAVVLEIALQVASALTAADECGLVHRDLKPANIMLAGSAGGGSGGTRARPASTAGTARGGPQVKVIDFGLAKVVSAAEQEPDADAPLTQADNFLGTPAYASPEQVAGGPLDTRSDIYSLGVTLWYLLTGRLPFAGATFTEIYDRQIHRTLPVAQLDGIGLSPAFAEVLKQMLAPSPARRPASPAVLREMLEEARRDALLDPPHPPGGGGLRRWPALLLLAGSVALAGLAGILWLQPSLFRSAPPPTPPAAAASEKSIAVLPLEDLSGGGANAFFADGIQDDLLSSLAKIGNLKVVSRSSVTGYRDPRTRNLREIGQQLGVATLLEGSVRRAADRVLVNVALSDAASGRAIWAEHYDRTLADALTLQGELATEIATALRATLSPEEKARVEARPTANADAYELYLRARDYHTKPYTLRQNYQTAVRLYEQALALDPDFVLAHARLSACLSFMYQIFEPSPELRERARAEAREALRLQPDSGEGSLANALCLYYLDKDYAAATRELEATRRLLPGSAETGYYLAGIHRRQGRWREAREEMRQASARDPRNARTLWDLLRIACQTRDWPAAAREGDRALAMAPDNAMLEVERRYVDFWARGDLAPLRATLARVPAGVDPDGEFTHIRWDAASLGRDFDAAERIVAASAVETVVIQYGATVPKAYFLGCTALARGDAGRARSWLETARAALEKQVEQLPQDAHRAARLGLVCAYLGRKEDAIRLGRHATALMPETKDAYLGPDIAGLLALIYARVGETDQALALIERLLRTPGPVMPLFDGSVTRSDLRTRWQWDPLRGDARFQALLASPEPATAMAR